MALSKGIDILRLDVDEDSFLVLKNRGPPRRARSCRSGATADSD